MIIALSPLAVVLGGIVVVECCFWVLSRAFVWVLSRPVPLPRTFLREQTRMLDRLIHDADVRERIHPVLGWEYRPQHGEGDDHRNAQGLRAMHEYSEKPAPGLRRIAFFGDSQVYCGEVGNVESWPAQMEQRWQVEALNYGVGGYGTDQAMLRCREEAPRLGPDTVVLAFTSVMATRVVSRYRRFQNAGDGPWFKPRFLLEGDGLRYLAPPVASRADAERLLANPSLVVASGEHDFWFDAPVLTHRLYGWSATYRFFAFTWPAIRRRYLRDDRIYKGRFMSPESEAFEILVRIFRELQTVVSAAGAEPMALMLPARSDLELYQEEGRASYHALREHLERVGLPVLDPVAELAAAPVEGLFAPGGHYSAKANAIVADAVAKALHLAPRSAAPGEPEAGQEG